MRKVRAKPALAMGPGAALKALRADKNLTLASLSRLSGYPVSTLSKIENGKMTLTYDKLAKLSEALQVDIAQLFSTRAVQAPAKMQGRRSVTRAGEGERIDTRNYNHAYPAGDLLNKQFIPIIAEVLAQSLEEFGELIQHEGEEYTIVLEGALELHTDVYAPLRLETGDSIYFDSSMRHAYIAAAPGVCRVLTICSRLDSAHAATAGRPSRVP